MEPFGQNGFANGIACRIVGGFERVSRFTTLKTRNIHARLDASDAARPRNGPVQTRQFLVQNRGLVIPAFEEQIVEIAARVGQDVGQRNDAAGRAQMQARIEKAHRSGQHAKGPVRVQCAEHPGGSGR